MEVDLATRCAAARLVVNDGSVVCDRTAAWLHGVDVHSFSSMDLLPPIESCVLRGSRSTERPECVGRTRDLTPIDWVDLHGLRVTSPLRTAADLACMLSRRDALAVVDALMRIHGLTRRDLRRLLLRYFRRRGVVQARQIVALADGRAESSGESWTRLEMVDRGLPEPVLQHWVLVDRVPTYRLDLAYPHARIAVEYDGEEHHTSVTDRQRDAQRREHLRALGWTVVVVTKRSFAYDEANAWIADVRAGLRKAA